METKEEKRTCPDCGVYPGEIHHDGCDVERCPDCGHQLISCDCEKPSSAPKLPWTGEWPGVVECREFGWYTKFLHGHGWTACDKDEPNASEDLNRLYEKAVWDRDQGRFVLPSGT